MSGSIGITKTLDRIATLAGAVSGLDSTRVKQGKIRFADSTDFERTVTGLTAETQGYFVFDLVERQASYQPEMGTFTVEGLLSIYLPKDTTTDGNSAVELAEALLIALMIQANYGVGGSMQPQEGGYVQETDKVTVDSGICYFLYRLVYRAGPICTDM